MDADNKPDKPMSDLVRLPVLAITAEDMLASILHFEPHADFISISRPMNGMLQSYRLTDMLTS